MPVATPSSRADDSRRQDLQRQRQRERLEQRDGDVDAEAEEGAGAEVHVAGIAAQDVPGGRQHDELQHHVADEEVERVVDQERRGRRQREEDGAADPEACPRAWLISRTGLAAERPG